MSNPISCIEQLYYNWRLEKIETVSTGDTVDLMLLFFITPRGEKEVRVYSKDLHLILDFEGTYKGEWYHLLVYQFIEDWYIIVHSKKDNTVKVYLVDNWETIIKALENTKPYREYIF